MSAHNQISRTIYSGKVPELYSRLARHYDLFTGYEAPMHREAVALSTPGTEERVLEVACGTGRATEMLAALMGPGARLEAVDITEAMLKRAEKRLDLAGLGGKVRLLRASAMELPYPDGEFDLLYNAYMFDLLDAEDFSAVLGEFKRVLRPGGRLTVLGMSKETPGRTFYEFLYSRGLLGRLSGNCRPVMMAPFISEAGFAGVKRVYRKHRSLLPLNRLAGTEIITAIKPTAD